MTKTRRANFRKKRRTNKKVRTNRKVRTNKKVRKPRRVSRRMRLRGGNDSNDLGKIFMEIVKNKKIQAAEGMKDGRQSDAYEQAGWKIEDLTEELRKKANNEEYFDEIMDLVDDYIVTERDMDYETRSNKEYYALGNGGQGDYDAATRHADLVVQLRDDLGVDIDPFNPYDEKPLPSAKRRRM
jgi:hypothetical protein